MTQTIKIKRSTTTGAPGSLENGELAYSSNTNTLYIGRPGGTTGDIDAIGGKVYIDKLDHTAGTLTASSAIIVDASSKIDVLNVDNITINGNTISSTDSGGNINLTPDTTGNIVLDGQTWPNAVGTDGYFLKTTSSGTLAWDAIPSGSFTLSDGTATDSFTTGSTLTFTGGTGVTTAVTNDEVTFSIGQAVGTGDNVTFAGVTADNIQVGVTGTNEIDTSSGNLTIDSAGGTVTVDDNLIVAGNLTVQGTTTTVDSTVITVEDPIFTLGGTGSPTTNDGKDRGIEFHYNTGSGDTLGFFGYDISAGKFTFIPDATNTSEVFSGTAGTILADFEVSSSFTIGGHALDDVNITGEFTDDDSTLMTAAAIDDRILSYNYTTNTGTVTSIEAGTGLSGGTITTTGTIALDFSELTDMTGDISAGTEFIVQDGTTESRKAASEIKLSFFNNDSGWTSNTGTVTSVATGTGLSGGAITTSGTIDLDFDNIAEKTGDLIGSDRLTGVSGTTHFSETISNIPLSIFNNDSGWTSNTGDITSITLQNASSDSPSDTSILFGLGGTNTATQTTGDATFILRVGTIDGGTY